MDIIRGQASKKSFSRNYDYREEIRGDDDKEGTWKGPDKELQFRKTDGTIFQ